MGKHALDCRNASRQPTVSTENLSHFEHSWCGASGMAPVNSATSAERRQPDQRNNANHPTSHPRSQATASNIKKQSKKSELLTQLKFDYSAFFNIRK